ncbi:hypothetical protein R6Q59_019642 [Mikania micrantha]
MALIGTLAPFDSTLPHQNNFPVKIQEKCSSLFTISDLQRHACELDRATNSGSGLTLLRWWEKNRVSEPKTTIKSCNGGGGGGSFKKLKLRLKSCRSDVFAVKQVSVNIWSTPGQRDQSWSQGSYTHTVSSVQRLRGAKPSPSGYLGLKSGFPDVTMTSST